MSNLFEGVEWDDESPTQSTFEGVVWGDEAQEPESAPYTPLTFLNNAGQQAKETILGGGSGLYRAYENASDYLNEKTGLDIRPEGTWFDENMQAMRNKYQDSNYFKTGDVLGQAGPGMFGTKPAQAAYDYMAYSPTEGLIAQSFPAAREFFEEYPTAGKMTNVAEGFLPEGVVRGGVGLFNKFTKAVDLDQVASVRNQISGLTPSEQAKVQIKDANGKLTHYTGADITLVDEAYDTAIRLQEAGVDVGRKDVVTILTQRGMDKNKAENVLEVYGMKKGGVEESVEAVKEIPYVGPILEQSGLLAKGGQSNVKKAASETYKQPAFMKEEVLDDLTPFVISDLDKAQSQFKFGEFSEVQKTIKELDKKVDAEIKDLTATRKQLTNQPTMQVPWYEVQSLDNELNALKAFAKSGQVKVFKDDLSSMAEIAKTRKKERTMKEYTVPAALAMLEPTSAAIMGARAAAGKGLDKAANARISKQAAAIKQATSGEFTEEEASLVLDLLYRMRGGVPALRDDEFNRVEWSE